MTCEDCIHHDLCVCVGTRKLYPGSSEGCRFFTDKNHFVKLPCKLWDKVWIIDKTLDHVNGGLKKTVCEGEIFKLSYNGFTTPMEWLDYRWDSPLVGQTTRHDRIDLCFGKTVFLTREEAEAALEKMKG